MRDYYSDIPIMIEIAKCESQFVHIKEDGTILRGWMDENDTGVMQINTHYHEEEATDLDFDLDMLEDNLKFARLLYERNGVADWSASKDCWSK